MRLTTKSRYGVRALIDIACTSGALPVLIRDISCRQKLSMRYLEQIFHRFKKAGILRTKRGRHGGYFLARKPELITLREILEAAEGDTLIVDCIEKRNGKKAPGEYDNSCVTQTVWHGATEKLNEFFNETTLKSICEKQQAMGVNNIEDCGCQ
jgi:Rrf2 family transcriptional regulator, iron-sulfur cluster assembly transcription factor